MHSRTMTPSRRATGFAAGVCALGALIAGCSPDETQGPPVEAAPPGIEASLIPTGGLIGEWKLDGNVSDTKSGFNAILYGNPPYTAAKIGKGLDLTGNGTNGLGEKYAELPSNATLDNLSEGAEYSISAWFNPASAPSGAGDSQFWMVVGKTNTQAIGIVYNMNQRFAARHYTDEGGNVLQLATATTTSALNQWHHVVAVVKKGSATVPASLVLYVDGDSSSSDTWTGGTPAKDFGPAPWRIGRSDLDWSANGRVDQVRFYNVALTQAQVTELFQETATVSAYDVHQVGANVITVDGNLAEWSTVPAISLADSSGRTGGADNTARIKLAWDETYLYAAYDVSDTELRAFQTTRDASELFHDDAVELYIDPQGDGAGAAVMDTTDYQLLANVQEVLGDKNGDGAGGKSASYNAASFLAKAVANGTINMTGTDAGYTIELRISWSDLGVTPSAGHFMRINPAVDDRDDNTPPPHYSFAWGGVPGDYDNPVDWKDIRLVADGPSEPPSSSNALPVGLWNTGNFSDLGKGPGPNAEGDTQGPYYGVSQGIPPVNAADLDAYIAKADSLNILLVLTLAGGRTSWDATPGGCINYSETIYKQQVDRFKNHAKLGDAIARRRAIVFLVDEPWKEGTASGDYCSAITPAQVNNMGLHVKSNWPRAITTVRGPAVKMVSGWSGQAPPLTNGVRWSGVDYGWSQYNHVAAVPENQTPQQFFQMERDSLADVNLGMIPGINIWSGGDKTCWDVKMDGTSGRLTGSTETVKADFVPCSTDPANSVNWVARPDLLRAAINAAVTDTLAPFFSGWNHVGLNPPTWTEPFQAYETRSDFVAALDYWITKGATRSRWAGWRTAK